MPEALRLTRDTVTAWGMQRDPMDYGVADDREGYSIPPGFGPPYFNFIAVPPDLAQRILAAGTFYMEDQLSEVVGHEPQFDGTNWKIQIRPEQLWWADFQREWYTKQRRKGRA